MYVPFAAIQLSWRPITAMQVKDLAYNKWLSPVLQPTGKAASGLLRQKKVLRLHLLYL